MYKQPKYPTATFCKHWGFICGYLFLVSIFNIGFWYGSFARKRCILVFSTKKWYSSFLKEVFVFQKICFKVKVLKMFKISTDCHIKHIDLPNRGLFLKSLVPFFRRTYALFVGFKMKPLSVFQCQNRKQIKFCRKACLQLLLSI